MAVLFADLLPALYRDTGDSSATTHATLCLNQAQREVGRMRPWPELRTRAFFNTVAAYSTGTIAVANAGTTWTLTGGTFPTDVATGGYRIALSVSDPWYTITTRTDGTHVETAAYQDATQTASAYIAYKPHYSLTLSSGTLDRLLEVWLHAAGRAVPLVNAETDQNLTQFVHHPSGPGVPCAYLNIERDASGIRQILLGPNTPDDVYRVEFTGIKATTDGTYSLDDSRWPVVLSRAKAMLYERDNYERSLKEMERFRVLLQDEWASTKETEDRGVQVGQARVAYPQGDDPWLSSLPDFGTTVTIT